MVANAILYCSSYEHSETSKNALCLVPKKRVDWDAIHEKNDVIETSEDLASVKKQLKQDKHTCLLMRTKHLRAYKKPLQDNGNNLRGFV